MYLTKTMHEMCNTYSTVSYSFIHSGYFYSGSSSPLLLRGTPDTAWIMHQSFTPKRHKQLQVKDLPKVPTRDSNTRPFRRKATNIPMSLHAPFMFSVSFYLRCSKFG